MAAKLTVFVSYSRQDAEYLQDDSLLGFLKGLEKEGVEFWTDRQIHPGELWDTVIKDNLQNAQIALVLVSQSFLDSDYFFYAIIIWPVSTGGAIGAKISWLR